MASPQTVEDVRAWRELRERQADARADGAAIAEAVAATHERLGSDPDGTAQWREQAATYREQAGTMRATLPALDELERRVKTAAATPQDAAAWRAAAAAADAILRGSGQDLRHRALDASATEMLREFGEAAEAREEKREALSRKETEQATSGSTTTTSARCGMNSRRGLRAKGRVAFADPLNAAFIERARELAVDPDLDAGSKDKLRTFLHEHDVVQPYAARRCRELTDRWEGICARAKAQGLVPHAMPESAAAVDEMRALAAGHPAHLTPERKKAFEDAAAAYDRLRQRQSGRQLGQGRSM